MKATSEMDHLEARLRCWKPRRASGRLERRLFRRAAAGPGTAKLAGWLAPAAACLLFTGIISNSPGDGDGSRPSPNGVLAAMIWSNQSYAAYLPGSFHRAHNQLERWTAEGGVLAATNLIR